MSTTRSPLWKKLDFETQRSVFSTSKSEINLNATERVLHAFFPASEGLVLLQGNYTVHGHMIAILSTTWTVEILGFSRWIRSKESGTTRSTLWQFLGFYVGSAPKQGDYTLRAVEILGF